MTPADVVSCIAERADRQTARDAAGMGMVDVLGLYRIEAQWGGWFAWKARVHSEPPRLYVVTINRERRLVVAETTTLDDARRVLGPGDPAGKSGCHVRGRSNA